jgi:autotransporter-associated beta strand protein
MGVPTMSLMSNRFTGSKSRAALCGALMPVIAMTGTNALAGPYSPLPGQAGSTAIPASDSSIVEWASGATIVRGLRDVEDPTEYSSDPNSPLNHSFFGGSDGASIAASNASIAAGDGAITSTANTAPIGEPPQPQQTSYGVALGQNGYATLTFSQPITNGPGPDFAVFNNGFSSGSQEWDKPALVEVSSNGINFFAFPSVSLTQTTTQVGDYGELDPTNLYDIAGNFPAGYGTPFDLSELAGVSPLLNVNDVTQVRILSVSGDINPAYATRDSTGNIINAPWPAPTQAGSEGFILAGVAVLNAAPVVGLTWSNAAGTGVWNVGGAANWNIPGAAFQNGNAVTFDNSIITTNQTITLNTTVSPASITVNNSTGSYTITGTGTINGSTGLTKLGTQKLTLATSNTYTGMTVVNAGTLELAATGALPVNNALTIAAGATMIADPNTGLLILSSLNLDPTSTGTAVGKLDLTDTGLVVHNGNLATLTAAIQAGSNNLAWNGSAGIVSSTAAADTAHLTALGVMQNADANGNAIYTSVFDRATGLNLTSTDVLARYTWYGDANLDGHVDGSDYSLIDNGFLNQLTGWQNGDFNYDGVVNGSDYTLIDNAFNQQGAAIPASITAQVAPVPEPARAGIGVLASIALTRRRRRN